MTKTLIAIIGPTGIGKTSRAIGLARHFNTEIFSADSRQFFKEMKIGTAVPSDRELDEVKHHFIQHISILDSYTVGDFEREMVQSLEKFFEKNDVAILVGGSGLYVDAILYGLDDFPEVLPEVREELNALLHEKGISVLQKKLETLDVQYYNSVDLENPHRLIRALEVCISSGRPYSSFLRKKTGIRKFRHVLIGLCAQREVVYDRINQRVDLMLKQGLLEEAKSLYQHRNLNALKTVGYKELFEHFSGKTTLEHAIEEIKKNTRRFAKRQLTWYRKNKDVLWFNHDLTEKEFIVSIEESIKNVSNATE